MISQADFFEILERRTGLTLESLGGERSLLLAIRRSMEAAGFIREEQWREAALHSTRLWDDFVHEVIVPETFLFRYPESFQALSHWLAQEGHRYLRVLCLPCSTGEEAYSLAMTLAEAGLAWDQFSILAIDIDARSIQDAEKGEYFRSSAIRNAMAAEHGKYWKELPGGGFAVAPDLRRSITFRVLNLWDLSPEGEVFDVIFCRNLLIYFSEANQSAALEKLGRLLTQGGLLFLGPAEVPVAGKLGWVSAGYSMAFACRKAVEKSSLPARLSRRSVASSKLALPVVPAQRPAAKTAPTAVKAASVSLSDIRTLADRGKAKEAQMALQDYLKTSPNDVDALVLDGVLSENRGDNQRAEANFRQAIYLKPDQTEAMAHLALLLEADGRVGAAKKLRERAERISIR